MTLIEAQQRYIEHVNDPSGSPGHLNRRRALAAPQSVTWPWLRCAAERDLAVAALRRIRDERLGAGDMDMIAADALHAIGEDAIDWDYPADLAYSEASEFLVELNGKTNEE